MLFNSYIFLLVFLPLCLAGYYVLNRFKLHTVALLELIGMSLWFYGYFNYSYLLILCGSIVANWLVSRGVSRLEGNKRKVLLVLGITADILLIFYFKYYDFFVANVNAVFKTSFELRYIILPLGISFFTFQQISYLVDSYRGETKDYKFIEYAAFVSFFPQLVAGPIVLHNEFVPQIRDESKRCFNHDNFAFGISALAVGLFKKVLIADTFGIAVSWAWGRLTDLSSVEILLIMICYTFQIYFDFSGYCDMAVGLGRMFNIELPVNFNSPYKADSILEFWKRWHMTLTRFLRNYIYFPLGGSRKGKTRTYLNIMLVFLISGLWHGANWTFVLWGVIHGVANVLNRIFSKAWEKCNQVFKWICTFAFLNVTWLLFRADSVHQAGNLLGRMLKMDSFGVQKELLDCFQLPEFYILQQFEPWRQLTLRFPEIYMWIFILGALFICLNTENIHNKVFKASGTKAIAMIVMLVWSIVSFSGVSTFLYFNF